MSKRVSDKQLEEIVENLTALAEDYDRLTRQLCVQGGRIRAGQGSSLDERDRAHTVEQRQLVANRVHGMLRVWDLCGFNWALIPFETAKWLSMIPDLPTHILVELWDLSVRAMTLEEAEALDRATKAVAVGKLAS